MTFKFFVEICLLSAGLLTAGSLLCLPLYHWRLRDFFASRLWVKIYWWLPILAGFLAVLTLGWPAAVIVAGVLLLQAGREWRRSTTDQLFPTLYFSLFIVAIMQLITMSLLPDTQRLPGLAAICFASVLSDVCAFFAGSYGHRYPLPSWINDHKYWEGVAGQIVGAVVGLGLIALTPEVHFSWTVALGVGIASAVGDLTNSVAKRQLGIKDWSQAIPGHGGVLDRFSSLSFALAVGYMIIRCAGLR